MFHSLLMAFSFGYSEKYVTQMSKYDILHLYLLFYQRNTRTRTTTKIKKKIVIVTNMLLCKYQEKKNNLDV